MRGTSAASVAGIAEEGGKFFIARRKRGGDIGGKWEFPGGKVEEGESDGDALIREYEEEFGIAVKPGPLLGTATFEHHGKERILHAYQISFSGCPVLREHTEWRWASLDEIETLDFAGSDRLLLESLKAYFQK